MASRARGTALMIVLWVTALLAILLGSFIVTARTEQLQTRHLYDSTRARYAAEAGISRAVYELRRSDPVTRWVPDGRVYTIDFEGTKVELAITDESGKLDLNSIDVSILVPLFRAVGVEEIDAAALADAVMDWRDPDDLTGPNGAEDADYEAAGLPYGAADKPFTTVGELQQVLGMDHELFRKLEPHLTVYSRSAMPTPAFASSFVLSLLPGMTPEIAAQLVAQRRATPPDQLAATPILLPDGTPMAGGGGGLTYTVASRATLPSGAWTVLDVTLRAGGVPGGRAFAVLRWREGGTAEHAFGDADAAADAAGLVAQPPAPLIRDR